MIKNILHLVNTPCAGAPGMLSSAINSFTHYNSKIYVKRKKLKAGDFSIDYKDSISVMNLSDEIEKADLIHLHNQSPKEWGIPEGKPFIIQLHSEPSRYANLVKDFSSHCITLSQKHAILYKVLPHIPNIISLYNEEYNSEYKRDPDKVVIVYAPTSQLQRQEWEDSNYKNTCMGKGYHTVIRILNEIEKEYGNKVEIHILEGISKEKVLMKKRMSDIVIDECVTGGYHLSALEGFATGNIVIGRLLPEVQELVCEVTGCDKQELPWLYAQMDPEMPMNLKAVIKNIIKTKFEYPDIFEGDRRLGINWINTHWRPEKLVKHIESMYNSVLDVSSDPYTGLTLSNDIHMLRRRRKRVYIQYNAADPNKELTHTHFKNKEFNRPALIIGLGPSLNKINFTQFAKDIDPVKLYCNHYFLEPAITEKPDYWFNIDSKCLFQCLFKVPEKVPVIMNPPPSYNVIKHKRCFINLMTKAFEEFFRFDYQLERPSTVATIMTLWAIYMGCNPIYIIGVDLSLENSNQNYSYSTKTDKRSNDKFRNFSTNYHSIIREFKLMKEEAKRLNIKIYNLDPEPKNFKVFPCLGEVKYAAA